MLTVTWAGMDALLAQLAAFPDAASEAVAEKTQALAQALADKVQQDKLSGQVLNTKTGVLKGSISSSVDQDGSVITGNVFVDGDVPYAAIQEYGGTTKAHVIEAVNAKALAFSWQGKTAVFKRVNHPGSVLPERSYLRSSLADFEDDIVQGFRDALSDAIDSNF